MKSSVGREDWTDTVFHPLLKDEIREQQQDEVSLEMEIMGASRKGHLKSEKHVCSTLSR